MVGLKQNLIPARTLKMAGLSAHQAGGGFAPGFDRIATAPLILAGVDKLWPSYTGPTVRLKRSTDSAEQDFTPGPSGRLLWATVRAWAGYAPPEVTRLYNQVSSDYFVPSPGTPVGPRLVTDDDNRCYIRANGINQSLYLAAATVGKATAGLTIGIAGMDGDSVTTSAAMVQATGNQAGIARLAIRGVSDGSYGAFGRRQDYTSPSITINSAAAVSRTRHRSLYAVFDHTANQMTIAVDGVETVGTGGGTGLGDNSNSADGIIIGGNGSFPSAWSYMDLSAVIVHNSPLSVGDRALLKAALDACKITTEYVSITNVKLVTDGNSQTETAALGQTAWPTTIVTLAGLKSGMGRTLVNRAVSGQTIDAMLGDAVAQIDADYSGSVPSVLTVWESVNALASYTAREYVDKIWEYVDGRLAAHPGWHIVVAAGGAQTAIDSANTIKRHDIANLIADEWRAHGVAGFLDLRSIPLTQDPTNSTYFFDAIHLKTAGNTLVARAMRDVITHLPA